MLGSLEDAAQQEQLKQQFRHHAEETRQQIANLEQAFGALGEEPDDRQRYGAVLARRAGRTRCHDRADRPWAALEGSLGEAVERARAAGAA